MCRNSSFFLGLMLGFILLTGQAAHAQTSRLYFAGYLGLNSHDDEGFTDASVSQTGEFKMSNSTSFAGALGVRLTPQWRVEGEYSYSRADFSSVDIPGTGSFDTGGEMKSKIIFANLYYDFDVPWKIQPFVGGGLGVGFHSGEINDGSGVLSNASSDDTAMMWNFGGGIKYRPKDDMAFTAGYRYVDSMDLNFGNYTMEAGGHEFRIGLEWDLPVGGR